jgi:hypothetical protein
MGFSESHFDDPSGGYGPVATNRPFDESCFPCKGYMLSLGGTLGVFDSDGGSGGGGSWNIYFFGAWPFAGVRCWGAYHATTPGAGVGGGIAGFGIDDD